MGEPLVQFAAISLVLVALDSKAPSTADAPLGHGHIAEEEALYREALRLGLDREDVIVRRRLIQKMGFLIDEMAAVKEPTQADLQRWLDEHALEYRIPSRRSFRHAFFADRAPTAKEIAAAQQGLPTGDVFARGDQFTGMSKKQVARLFGHAFADKVMELEVGAPSAPLPSPFGTHIVFVTEHREARAARLHEIEPRLRRDYIAGRRKTAASEQRAHIVARYQKGGPQ